MIRKKYGTMTFTLGLLIILNIQHLLLSEACPAQGCAQTKKEESLELQEGLQKLCSQIEEKCKGNQIKIFDVSYFFHTLRFTLCQF